MKKIIVTLYFSILILPLFATHIVGGSMTYEHVQGNEYKIQVQVLRDCFNGEPPFDDPAAIGVFDENGQLLTQYLVNFDPAIDDTISLIAENSVCEFPPTICIHQTTYEQNIIIPSNQPVIVAYQRCCRSSIITNIADALNVGLTFWVSIDPADENSSITFNNDVPLAVFANTPFSYNASATDIDGDSLVYELSVPFAGPTPDNPLPQPPNPPPYPQVPFLLPNYSIDNMLGGNYPLEIDSNTGEMTAIPGVLGVFQIGYKAHEFRDGILLNTTFREFTFVVVPPPADLNFDVSGQVFVDTNVPLDKGWIRLLERDVTTDSLMIIEEQTLDVTGAYSFENINPGVFYLKAYVDPTSAYYDDYLPTYYGESAFWYNAENLNQCDTSQQFRDIYLLDAAENFGYEEFSSYITKMGIDPVPNLDLLLAKPDGTLIKARTTDEDGQFAFENIANENYLVFVDLINSAIDNTNPPEVGSLDFIGYVGVLYEDYLEFQVSVSDVEEVSKTKKMQLFPNPSDGMVKLNLKNNSFSNFKIIIHDCLGKQITQYEISDATTVCDLTNLPTGLYNLSLFENGLFVETQRLLINHGK